MLVIGMFLLKRENYWYIKEENIFFVNLFFFVYEENGL